jgi:hypothetical protein
VLERVTSEPEGVTLATGKQQPLPSALTAVRGGYGALLLLAPGPVLRVCTGQSPSATARWVTRLLGARHLTQAALTARYRAEPGILGAGAALDLVHASSMAGLAAVSRSARRAALTDMVLETLLAAAGSVAAQFEATGFELTGFEASGATGLPAPVFATEPIESGPIGSEPFGSEPTATEPGSRG